MLRPVYRLLLRLHPPYFRQRFADEMMSIFDQAQNRVAEIRMLADGVVSLFRQWSLRPEYWAAPVAQPASDGVPLFQTIGDFKPRKDALLDGMLLTVATFTAICLAFGYTWNHPIFLTLRPIHQGIGAVPKIHAAAPPRIEVPVYTPDGRVVLVFGNPSQAHPDATIPGATVGSAPSGTAAISNTGTSAIPETSLESYAGTYSSDSGLVLQISQRGANLELATAGQPSGLFAPASETRFDEVGVTGRWIEFQKQDGTATMLILHQGNLQVTAYRR